MSKGLLITLIVVAVAVIIFIAVSYVKSPPSHAFIISGIRKNPKVLIGTGGFRIPYFQRLDKVFLGQVTVDVKTDKPVPTRDFINVDVDAVCKVRVKLKDPKVTDDWDGIGLAAKNFLNMTPLKISEQIQASLEGNMREVVGSIGLKELNTDRKAFSDSIEEKAAPDMKKLGLEIISCNIQNITDGKGLVENLGADNTWEIKKNASMKRITAEKEIKIAEADAKKESNQREVESETEIATKQNELSIKKSELKVKEDTKRAEADAAYEITSQEQQKVIKQKKVEAEAAEQILTQEKQLEINEKQVSAEIARAKKQKDYTAEVALIKQNELDAEVKKQADAEKYNKTVSAEAELEQRKKKADAELYEAQKQIEAIKLKADADLYKAKQEAEGIKLKGEADAAATKAKGEAEAEAMSKKAEAFQKYGGAAIADMMVGVLPDVAKAVAEPMGNISNLNIYGTSGEDATTVSKAVPVVIKQSFDTVKSVTGVDLGGIMENSQVNAASVDVNK